MNQAIYGLEPIGAGGAYEATGEVHFYCCNSCATQDALTRDYVQPAYSEAQDINSDDFLSGTVCEWCGQELATLERR